MEAPNPRPDPQDEQPAHKKPKMSSSSTDDNTPTSPRQPPRYKRRKIAIFFAYCGVGYQGMQKNPGAKTIEGDLEEALFLSGAVPEEERGQHKKYDWARSARTDKGVSAVGQVVSGRFFVDPPGFVQRLNGNLCPQIRVFGFKRVTPTYSAKKFCDRRRYVYLLPVFALDATCHRDRESVMESVGSGGGELVKCGECSERGRKVAGVMGNRKDGFLQSGVSSNILDARMLDAQDEVDKDKNVEGGKCDGEELGNGGGGLGGEGLVESVVLSNGRVLDGEEKVWEDGKVNVGLEKGNGVAETDVLVGLGVSSNNGEGEKGKRCEFKYGDEVRERFNRILKYYEGTHNFHNFTTRTKAEDPSAKRYIVSFTANTTLTLEGIEFVKCEVVGQSFMLHQIRKMMGLAVAVMRNFAPESVYETAFDQTVRINVPTAPEVGLYLDECFFTSYNNKWNATHEEVSMKAYAEEAEEFKLKYIYSHIANTEHKEGSVGLWLHSLNRRNYPDLCPSDEGVGRAAEAPEGDNVAVDLCPVDGEAERATGEDIMAADLCPSDGGVERAAGGDKMAVDLCPSDGALERTAEGDITAVVT